MLCNTFARTVVISGKVMEEELASLTDVYVVMYRQVAEIEEGEEGFQLKHPLFLCSKLPPFWPLLSTL